MVGNVPRIPFPHSGGRGVVLETTCGRIVFGDVYGLLVSFHGPRVLSSWPEANHVSYFDQWSICAQGCLLRCEHHQWWTCIPVLPLLPWEHTALAGVTRKRRRLQKAQGRNSLPSASLSIKVVWAIMKTQEHESMCSAYNRDSGMVTHYLMTDTQPKFKN